MKDDTQISLKRCCTMIYMELRFYHLHLSAQSGGSPSPSMRNLDELPSASPCRSQIHQQLHQKWQGALRLLPQPIQSGSSGME